MARPWVGAETVNMDLTQFLLLRRRRGGKKRMNGG